ncbi:MAG: hypothetical protein L6R36_005992 [Xanthoria steineri]|nr:MAG: hypothetical protein L6R36_005992 [Xanthoria steineri]
MPYDRYRDRGYDYDYDFRGYAGRYDDPMVLQGDAMQRGAFHGPTLRERRANDKDLEVEKWVRESDGEDYLYLHVKNIGVGGQGQCDLYRRSGKSNRLVVCKVMKDGFDLTYDRKGRRKPAEAIILKDILGPHPLICNLQAFTSHRFWFEYCALGDLQDLCDGYIERGTRIPESFVWHSYRQLAEAFAFIHEGYSTHTSQKPPHFQPVVHRDVKPSNIFIRENPRHTYPDLVLADFGVAITNSALKNENGYILGTTIYQPPEIPYHSRAGDIWSAGACIHVLTTGSPPIKALPKGQSSKDWYRAPEARAVADLRSSGYSHNLHAAVMWTLRKRREDRVMGKELVSRVAKAERDYLDKGGPKVALARWVGKK